MMRIKLAVGTVAAAALLTIFGGGIASAQAAAPAAPADNYGSKFGHQQPDNGNLFTMNYGTLA
ncbi:hypothetical protein SSP35_03_00650 [Streptomyces sp. NBRC 110611]|uniref:hypothetical protein n=1 Tax=Streptomyces sp. NBRC 110611 TaxID=1621259 RepID=UPI00082D449F|nr:hypothetical protein [Streptomyces sp. NBRC 110611]GAU66417.1 hypothetical protein SSP35_03_00650 [Streptomyces sp. NBRC 110611]